MKTSKQLKAKKRIAVRKLWATPSMRRLRFNFKGMIKLTSLNRTKQKTGWLVNESKGKITRENQNLVKIMIFPIFDYSNSQQDAL